jgi:four helix bundle protein
MHYRDLIIWQKARVLVKMVYVLTGSFPSSEQFGLTSQMRRSAVSIISNIAEGWRRGGKAEWGHFLRYAYGSAAELETQLVVASDIGYIHDSRQLAICQQNLEEISRMLNKLNQSRYHKK